MKKEKGISLTKKELTTGKGLLTLFREQTKYVKYTDFLSNINEFLDKDSKTCTFCTYSCGDEWCETGEGNGTI